MITQQAYKIYRN